MVSKGIKEERYGLIRIIYEKGIEVVPNDNGIWHYRSVRGGDFIPWKPQLTEKKYGLRPLLKVYRGIKELQEDLLSPTNPSCLDLYFEVETSLLCKLSEKHLSVEQFHDLVYILGALAYHCKRLAYSYCDIALRFATSKCRFEGEETGQTFAPMHTCEPLYEFDALITAAIRCYEMIRIVLCSIFPMGGNFPKSLKKFFNQCSNRLPKVLADRLSESWQNYGSQAKHYRDFIQHYYTLTKTGWLLPTMNHLGNNLWTVSIILPDNPELHSRKKFSFEKKIDALSYAWSIADEIATIYCKIADCISEESNQAKSS